MDSTGTQTRELAMAYVMNGMGMNLVDDPRKMTLLDAVYASVR